MIELSSFWSQGLRYQQFLERYATAEQRRRWDTVYQQSTLTPAQEQLLQTFTRQMQVVVLAGAWCGDCIEQCPMFARFAEATTTIDLRFFDRDDHASLADAVKICGGRRVPTVLFFSEDGAFCGLMGDRTLARYRDAVARLQGAVCPTGLILPAQELQRAVLQDWLNEFERVQWMLRTSPRLREKHGD
ncbi:MAG: hypothetical protein KatS3mg113_0711 [Planctomycetaceae bacterium]|nr:MAG: hypothetical protein KatS3mg113_0711 [Planctomycetaceae bacterium]